LLGEHTEEVLNTIKKKQNWRIDNEF
jgi:hypothetical protein